MSDYAPYPLITDASAFDLETTEFTGHLGTVVARHRTARSSSRATLFLHGAAGSWTTFTPLMLAARERGVEVHDPVLFDLPGWGDAVLEERDDTRTIDTVCELVRDSALALGYTEWDVVGHSMGGFIALHLGSLWPSSVRSIALISPTAWSVIESVEHPVRRFSTLPGFVGLLQVMRILSLLRGAGTAFVAMLARARILRPAVAPLFRHGWRIDSSVIRALGREIRPRSFVAATMIARDYDADATWASIVCPVRALRGDRDVFATAHDLTRLQRLLPATEVATVPDCGHFATVEQPHALLGLLAR